MDLVSETDLRRIAALGAYRVLDTMPEQGFDDLTDLAAFVCQTPIALISLVDAHRQWFKSKVGLELAETPIEQAVCAHAIKQADPLVIPDLTDDVRTKSNPLVTAPAGIRFYAGAPLITPEGIAIGTLCVIDREPRSGGLSDEQAGMLVKLAHQVVGQLELRRRVMEEARRALDEQLLQQTKTLELSHRLKNTLTTVQAIASQTFKKADPVSLKAFHQRLEALSATHEILYREGWTKTDILAIVQGAISALADIGRFHIDGCPIVFGPRGATTLSMIVHELITNAIKYGPLSIAQGTVSITWRVVSVNSGEETFVFEWQESGGPPVQEPAGKGFGSRLIAMGLSGTGTTRLIYDPTGFKAELTAPLNPLMDDV